MATLQNSLTTVDQRSFFEQAITYGVERGILTAIHLSNLRSDGPKGIVQIANHFGTAYLQINVETAAARMVNLISLYLEDKSDSNLQLAAISLRDNSLLSHSRGGSEMLKRLHALPQDTHLYRHPANPADEKSFIDERTFSSPMRLAEYREEASHRQEIQQLIYFARWVAGQLQAREDDYEDHVAEEIIHSALLVWCVGKAPFCFPNKSEFVKLITTIRKPSFKPQLVAFQKLLASAPEDFRTLAETWMQRFICEKLPYLQGQQFKPVEFIHGDQAGLFFVRESLEEEVGKFDQLVSKEWVRITKGKSDPASLFTLFLFIATGLPPKTTMLQKEAKQIVAQFRASHFDSDAVCQYIEDFAPYDQRPELISMWLEDLKHEAEIHLSDPEHDDTYMERALTYLRQNCASQWKGRN